MRRFVFFTLFLLLCALPTRAVSAQTGSAGDLLAAVNALRAQNGLPAYQADSSLMASAQAHADYMASIGVLTHARADGTSPADYAFIENIAGGLGLSPAAAVNSQWQDALHLSTILGISDGFAGAGSALRDGVVYYTLQVRRAPGSQDVPLPAAPAAPAEAGAVQPVSPASVARQQQTPQPDGSIIHTVQEGESVWSIADLYDMDVNDLIALNGLPPNPTLFPGQKLTIRLAQPPTKTPTATETLRPPTRTPAPTATRRPPTLTPTITPPPTATPFSLRNLLPPAGPDTRRNLGIGLIVVCVVGLASVIAAALRK